MSDDIADIRDEMTDEQIEWLEYEQANPTTAYLFEETMDVTKVPDGIEIDLTFWNSIIEAYRTNGDMITVYYNGISEALAHVEQERDALPSFWYVVTEISRTQWDKHWDAAIADCIDALEYVVDGNIIEVTSNE